MSQAYVTLLLNDAYLPGALVLAHSLKKLGTQNKIIVLISNIASVSDKSITYLEQVFDEVIPITPIKSSSVKELGDLKRPDLAETFSKILLWNQAKYSKLVYLDSDTLPIKPIDELFDIDTKDGIAAAPDSGWPDIFNSGVLVLKPDAAAFKKLGDYIETAESPSFDGADQGLLNQFFTEWVRLPFIYNVTYSNTYQYLPAFNKFKDTIKVLHFIGGLKPWADKSNYNGSNNLRESYDRWWDVIHDSYSSGEVEEILKISRSAEEEADTHDKDQEFVDIPKFENRWQDLNINLGADDQDDSGDSGNSKEIQAIFPWEHNKVEATRVFDSKTDYFNENYSKDE